MCLKGLVVIPDVAPARMNKIKDSGREVKKAMAPILIIRVNVHIISPLFFLRRSGQ